jgi:hypothetical protein
MSTRIMNRRTRLGACSIVGTVGLIALAAAPASAETEVDRPDTFTSAFTVWGTPDNIVGPDGPTPGEPGATGTFDFMINSDLEIICYDITLEGVTPPYMSMAKTATHIHEAEAGVSGPPRISFPNPTGEGDVLTSSGCLQGPFTSGLEGDDGVDTGEGFTLAEIEEDPTEYYGDTHTMDYVAGAVRGQLTEVPVGGIPTGFGGTADTGDNSAIVMTGGAMALLGLTAAGAVAARRHGRG